MPGVIMCIPKEATCSGPLIHRVLGPQSTDDRTRRQQHRGARLPGPGRGRRAPSRRPVLRPGRASTCSTPRSAPSSSRPAARQPPQGGSGPDGLRAGLAHRRCSWCPRTVAIDDAVRDHGAAQVVVLGAGLDARAWRMPELARATVFEVDHPASQRDKQRRLGDLAPTAGQVVPVAVDLEHDPLAPALEAAGFDPALETTWVWEGVVPYLTSDAVAEGTVAPGRRAVRTRQHPRRELPVAVADGLGDAPRDAGGHAARPAVTTRSPASRGAPPGRPRRLRTMLSAQRFRRRHRMPTCSPWPVASTSRRTRTPPCATGASRSPSAADADVVASPRGRPRPAPQGRRPPAI